MVDQFTVGFVVGESDDIPIIDISNAANLKSHSWGIDIDALEKMQTENIELG